MGLNLFVVYSVSHSLVTHSYSRLVGLLARLLLNFMWHEKVLHGLNPSRLMLTFMFQRMYVKFMDYEPGTVCY